MSQNRDRNQHSNYQYILTRKGICDISSDVLINDRVVSNCRVIIVIIMTLLIASSRDPSAHYARKKGYKGDKNTIIHLQSSACWKFNIGSTLVKFDYTYCTRWAGERER